MLKQKELILICIIVVVAIGIGFCYAGKHEYFYMSKRQCEACRHGVQSDAEKTCFDKLGNKNLMAYRPCVDTEYKDNISNVCPGCPNGI